MGPVPLGDASTPYWWTIEPAQSASGLNMNLFDFRWTNRSRFSGTNLGNQSETSLTVPHWVLSVAFAIPPLAWLSGFWRDRRRYPPGHCASCGYDLRASSGRCPECGEAVEELEPSDALRKRSG